MSLARFVLLFVVLSETLWAASSVWLPELSESGVRQMNTLNRQKRIFNEGAFLLVDGPHIVMSASADSSWKLGDSVPVYCPGSQGPRSVAGEVEFLRQVTLKSRPEKFWILLIGKQNFPIDKSCQISSRITPSVSPSAALESPTGAEPRSQPLETLGSFSLQLGSSFMSQAVDYSATGRPFLGFNLELRRSEWILLASIQSHPLGGKSIEGVSRQMSTYFLGAGYGYQKFWGALLVGLVDDVAKQSGNSSFSYFDPVSGRTIFFSKKTEHAVSLGLGTQAGYELWAQKLSSSRLSVAPFLTLHRPFSSNSFPWLLGVGVQAKITGSLF